VAGSAWSAVADAGEDDADAAGDDAARRGRFDLERADEDECSCSGGKSVATADIGEAPPNCMPSVTCCKNRSNFAVNDDV